MTKQERAELDELRALKSRMLALRNEWQFGLVMETRIAEETTGENRLVHSTRALAYQWIVSDLDKVLLRHATEVTP